MASEGKKGEETNETRIATFKDFLQDDLKKPDINTKQTQLG